MRWNEYTNAEFIVKAKEFMKAVKAGTWVPDEMLLPVRQRPVFNGDMGQICQLLADGYSERQIAAIIGRSDTTVHKYKVHCK